MSKFIKFVENFYPLCYNGGMKKLYYATFEKGYEEIVKKIIAKQDKNSFIKKLYPDAILFFADEKFKIYGNCFKSAYLVIDNSQKDGTGALNAAMKRLLEKKDWRINFSKTVQRFKLLFLKEDSKVAIDAKLKQAVETMLQRKTKRQISYLNGTEELVFLSKTDGLNLFMRRLFIENEYQKVRGYEIEPEVAYMLNFLSEPSQSETVVDPFSYDGVVAYVRAAHFKKATVIANEKEEENVQDIKKLAKSLKEKSFSVMNYDFLSDKFPIKFIDKIVTVLPSMNYDFEVSLTKLYENFFNKAAKLSVKTIAVAVHKSMDISAAIKGKYDIEIKANGQKFNIFKLKLKNTTK